MDSKNSSRMFKKHLQGAGNAGFYEMFKKHGFYLSLKCLTQDEVPRSQFFATMKKEGNLPEYYVVERYLIAHKLIKFTIDSAGNEIKVALTEKGLIMRHKIEELGIIYGK